MSGKKRDAQKIKASERRILALEMRRDGKSYRDIADALGVSLGTAHRDVQKSLTDLAKQEKTEAKAYRMLIRQRIYMGYAAIVAKVKKGELWALDRWLALLQEEAKLFGLYEAQDVALHLTPETIALLEQMGISLPTLQEEFENMIKAGADHADSA